MCPLRRKVPAGILLCAALAALAAYGCAPRQPYRPVRRPPPAAPPVTPAPVPPSAPPAPVEPARPVPPRESPIQEEDVTSRRKPAPPVPPPAAPERKESLETRDIPPPPLPDDSSILAKITPGTSPQRAASLRLTEEGRKLLEAGDAARALGRLEKTIALDSTNGYGYFYLAKAQYRLGRYRESLNFLDVAESRLATEPFWLSEVHALRGENFRALGMSDKAAASYQEALRLNSGNRTALEARAGPSGERPAASR